MDTYNFPIDDSLIPKFFPSSKVRLVYKVMGKIMKIKKSVQLTNIEVYFDYKNDLF